MKVVVMVKDRSRSVSGRKGKHISAFGADTRYLGVLLHGYLRQLIGDYSLLSGERELTSQVGRKGYRRSVEEL
jgi:hypothetical protein